MKRLQNIAAASAIWVCEPGPRTYSPLIRKLEGLTTLSPADRAALEQISGNARLIEPRIDLLREGAVPTDAILVLEGFACRYKQRPNGARQNIAYLLPGDLCDVDALYLGRMDHTVGTLSTCVVARIPREMLARLIEQHPSIGHALRRAKLAEEATLRTWNVNLGCRSGPERMTHLFCELLVRLEAVGLAREGSYRLPITQIDLGDTLGLSNVHVNRVLKELRRKNLVEFRSKHLRLLNLPRVQAMAEFNPAYLQPASRENGLNLV